MSLVLDSHSTSCPDCGAILPAGSGALLCPVCVLLEDAEASPPLLRYTLLGEIARGGMGVVYRARQESLKRVVAVKILPGAAFSSQEFRQRFQREAETAASLNHPNIVAIHEIGELSGQPFIAMELVEGISLGDRLIRDRLTPELSAHIMRQVGRAVAHAHERGVIHRDLKPSNILLRDETEPMLTDFGLARFTQTGHTLTRSAQSLGSPGYLPPERVGLREGSPAVAEDVYGLGAVLYHCLTGRPPFMADSVAALLAATEMQEPVAPRLLNSSIPLDLQTICLRCLEKKPASRYASAQEVADELDRFLRGDSILARPVSTCVRVLRRAQRQPVLAGLSVALVLAIIAGTLGSFLGWQHAEREAEARRVELYSSNIAAAAGALNTGLPAQARSLLRDSLPGLGERDLRGPEWYLLQHLMAPQELFSIAAHGHILTTLDWSPSGQCLLSGAHDGSLNLWRLDKAGRLQRVQQILAPGKPRLNQVKWLDEESFICAESGGVIRLRKLGRDQPVWEINGAQFSLAKRAGLLAVSSSGPFYYEPAGEITLWKLGEGAPSKLKTFSQPGRSVALSPEGDGLAFSRPHAGRADVESGLWWVNLQKANEQPRLLTTPGPVWSLQFAPDGLSLAVSLFQGGADVLRFSMPSAERLPSLQGHSLRPWSVTFSADSQTQITTSSDRSIRAWKAGREVAQLTAAHENEIWCAALHPQAQYLATGDKDGVLKVFGFPLAGDRMAAAARFPHSRYEPLIFTPDSKAICLAQGQQTMQRSLLNKQAHKLNLPAPVAGYDDRGQPWVWNRSAGVLSRGDGGLSWSLGEAGSAFLKTGFSENGAYFYSLQAPGLGVRLEIQSGRREVVPQLLTQPLADESEVKAAKLSADGRYLAVASWHELALHDFKTHRTQRFPNDPHWARDIAFSSKGQWMATAGINGHIHLRHLPQGQLKAVLRGHIEEVSGVAFSPDGQTLVSSEIGLGLRFWRMDTLREVFYLRLEKTAEALRFSPDGRWLAVGLCEAEAAPETGQILILPVAPSPEP
ncbi:hypothetical protein GCM10023213_05410 [Prosthecobacter algae]|uniref:Protein kinase domain-containing protein n=1 Tax=Prosthecobacter algae TaxID=1144682 RepID=A0ABP9NVL1_9BACT